jgi:hypothetical protein
MPALPDELDHRKGGDERSRHAVNAARALATLAALLVLPAAGSSKDQRRTAGDLIWRHPQYAELAPASIALLPAASFDGNAERERLLTASCAAGLGGRGYRWMSATTSRAMLSGDSTGQTLMAQARAEVLQKARVDSTIARRMCVLLRVQAVLGVRLDEWESQTIEPSQSGKPWSRAYVRAALMDSTGRLLWSAEGSETVEGLEHEASTNATGIESSSPRNEFATGEGAPPKPQEVFQRIVTRWAAVFPPRSAAPDSAH